MVRAATISAVLVLAALSLVVVSDSAAAGAASAGVSDAGAKESSPVADSLASRWTLYKTKHRKQYASATENAERRAIWEANQERISAHNALADRGESTYRLGENHLADLKPEEYKALLGFRRSKSTVRAPRHTRHTQSQRRYRSSNQLGASSLCPEYVDEYTLTESVADLPSTVNWTAEGYVNPVEDQGLCGDCWAFAACGALEGQYYKVTKTSVICSEQNLLDCSSAEGDGGCATGGNMGYAYCYVMVNGGIDTAQSYPCVASDWLVTPPNDECKYNAADSFCTISSYSIVEPDSESALQQAVALIGPISVGINASLSSFQLYSGGVYSNSSCSSESLDHAMLAVGYGTTAAGQEYWLLKNSWGTSWGIQGYMMLARNDHNMCGVASDATFPTGLKAASGQALALTASAGLLRASLLVVLTSLLDDVISAAA